MKEITKTQTIIKHGEDKIDRNIYKVYYGNVIRDYKELKKEYPFSVLTIPPTVEPTLAKLDVVAVNQEVIERTSGEIEDFTQAFSKSIRVEVPLNYHEVGCKIYGGKWIDKSRVKSLDWHFDGPKDREGNHCFCLGVPDSFRTMDNVILECIKTADNMLTAYRRYLKGESKKLELNAFSHGKVGEREYELSQFRKEK